MILNWYPSAILTVAPIAFVTMTEHFGHVMVLNSLTGRDFFQDPWSWPYSYRRWFAQIIAGFFGAPVTSYGWKYRGDGLTRSIQYMLSQVQQWLWLSWVFIASISSWIRFRPAVLVGISIALLWSNNWYSGLKILVENKINFDNKKNLLIASVILVSGIVVWFLPKLGTSNHWCRNVSKSWDCVVSNPSRTKSWWGLVHSGSEQVSEWIQI